MTERKDVLPVLVVAGEGGSISLVRQQGPNGLLALSTQEVDYGLDDAEAFASPSLHQLSWEQALDALEVYPWRSLTPILVSAAHADMLQAAFRKQAVTGRTGDHWERLFTQTAPIRTIERHLHELIHLRAGNLIEEHGVVLPGLTAPADASNEPAWFPIPGMYGGFSYRWAGESSEPMLVVESWSRVVEGSGQRHPITVGACTLVDEGFV